jgi:hypothetical protein
MILQIATALVVGVYVVLAKDVQHKRLDANRLFDDLRQKDPRESPLTGHSPGPP